MNNHCAYCFGKFGLVRHRRAFKGFCSRACVEQHKAWLREQAHHRNRWVESLWQASLNVVPRNQRSPA
jgi:hypothetical protein